MGVTLPPDFVGFVLEKDGVEGDVGDEYIGLNPVSALPQLNRDLLVDHYMPGLVVIGSDGLGNGIGLDLRRGSEAIVIVPMIGMDWVIADRIAPTFGDYVESLLGRGQAGQRFQPHDE